MNDINIFSFTAVRKLLLIKITDLHNNNVNNNVTPHCQ